MSFINFNYFKKTDEKALKFYKEEIFKLFYSTFSSKKSFFWFKNRYEISKGICCPKDVYLEIFENLPLATINFKVKGCEKEDILLLDQINFLRIFKKLPNANKRNFSYTTNFPIISIYKNNNIYFLFNYTCKYLNTNIIVERFSKSTFKKIFNN
jgi:hypothetical protein